MASFASLPKYLRERIYALHLTLDEPIHHFEPGYPYGSSSVVRKMPPLLTLSPKMEAEAAPFYYAHNHFCFHQPTDIHAFSRKTWPRHLHLITKVTVHWHEGDGYSTLGFSDLARFKSLSELYIHVDERAMIKKMMNRGRVMTRFVSDEPTPQQQLAVLQYPGMAGLLKVSGVRHVQFKKHVIRGSENDKTGPIPGGILETEVARRLTSTVITSSKKGKRKKRYVVYRHHYLHLANASSC